MREAAFNIDLRQFIPSADKFIQEDYPEAIAKGFGDVARIARDDVRRRTRSVFKLHSDFIPNSIRSIPNKPSQISAAARSIDKHGDIEAAVYLAGSNNPKRDLSFMTNHETGEDKKPVSGDRLAIPASDISNYSYRSSATGATRKRWDPEKLLEYYNKQGPHKAGPHTNGGVKGKPFIIRGKSGTFMIARRKTRKDSSLEFLYSFKKNANIKARWHFEDTVTTSVAESYTRTISRRIKTIK